MTTPLAEANEGGDLVARDLAITTRDSRSVVERWLEEGEDKTIARIDAMIKVLDRLRKASIQATQPSDWIVNVSRDFSGNIIAQRAYLQDIGAERAGKIWGIAVSEPSIEREDFPDGTYAYHMVAEATARVTGEKLEYVEGSRWSGDKFFQKGLKDDEKPDPVDLRKSAWANLHGRAVRSLAGLGGVPVEFLAECGLDTKRCVFVDYGKGAKGGESSGAQTGASGFDVVMKFGKGKGKSIAELNESELDYYISAAERDLKDESKKQYHSKTSRELALFKQRREQLVKDKEAGVDPVHTDSGAAATGTDTGQKRTALFKRVTAACNTAGSGASTFDLVKALTNNKHSSLTGMPDKEMDRLLALSEDDFIAAAFKLADDAENS